MNTSNMTPCEISKFKKEWFSITKTLKESGLDLSKIPLVESNPDPRYFYNHKKKDVRKGGDVR